MAKKNDKSSKTAHVLNLITSPAEKAAQKAAAEAETNLPEVDETTDSSAAGFASEAAEAAAVNQQAAQGGEYPTAERGQQHPGAARADGRFHGSHIGGGSYGTTGK